MGLGLKDSGIQYESLVSQDYARMRINVVKTRPSWHQRFHLKRTESFSLTHADCTSKLISDWLWQAGVSHLDLAFVVLLARGFPIRGDVLGHRLSLGFRV